MINRVLIRQKVVQMVYAYYQGDGKDLRVAEKEFNISLEKAYELYNFLLLLIPAVTDFGRKKIELSKTKYLPTEEERNPNMRFVSNRFAAQLSENKTLNTYSTNNAVNWSLNDDFLKLFYDKITKEEFYKEYMEAKESTYDSDKDLWRKIFKRIIPSDNDLAELLEEKSIFWNDDLEIVSTFVVKTIKRFQVENGADEKILPMYNSPEDKVFANRLFINAIVNEKEYRQYIDEAIKNWDLDRLAVIDLLIIQVAMAELIAIEDIPVKVTLNEYIEIAKYYSSPKSKNFVNGILDHIVTKLRNDNKLFKS